MTTSGALILLVDDDPAVLEGVSGLLRDEGYRTLEAASAAAARRHLADAGDPPTLVLLDIRMPVESGLDLLRSLPQPLPVPVVVLSGEASVADTVTALKLGATDFIEKPPSPERLLVAVRNAVSLSVLAQERAHLLDALAAPGRLVGASAAMETLRRTVARVGPSRATVLITGETGTGKERVARALHAASGRAGRFVAVNCAAIPATLLESELLGYERGAFSGATARHAGRIEQAHGGTLLLDEIGDMPADLQAKLLRVIETREIERLGGSAATVVDVRVLASTHRDLGLAVREGRFREDLFYRLNVFPIEVPPLRSRPEDVVPLAQAFAAELVGERVPVTVTADGEALLRAHTWPGNVRELRNLVERVSLLRPDERELRLDAGALAPWLGGVAVAAPPAPAMPALGDKSLRELLDDYERAVLKAALERSGGRIAPAARLLGMDRGNLHRRLRALGVTPPAPPGE